jgi:GNAT superfamily N-acetyltransferase
MADTLTLRVATDADLTAVSDLLARSYPRLLKPDYPSSVMVTAVPLISRVNPGLVTSGRYYVAALAGHGVVGAGGWSGHSRANGRAELRHLVTDPRFTRRGIARRIVLSALNAASTQQFGTMRCLATRTAVPFYTAMGFSVIGPLDIGLAPGITFPVVQMTRPI